MTKLGAYVHESILSYVYWAHLDNEQKAQLMQSMCAMILTSSYDAVRRLTWELAMIDFEASDSLLKKGKYAEARTCIDSALQFLGKYNDAEVHLTTDEPFISVDYSQNNPFQTPKQYQYKLEDAQKLKQSCEVHRLFEKALALIPEANMNSKNVNED